jgi:hypothetical protein
MSCGFKNYSMERLYVVPNDICKLTGRKLRYGQQLLKTLRTILNKQRHQVVTKKELADYLDIDEALIVLD